MLRIKLTVLGTVTRIGSLSHEWPALVAAPIN
jgi:hypothetical protein